MAIKTTAAASPLEMSFKIKKRVTLPLIKLPENTPLYIKPLEPMVQAPEQKGAKKDKDGNVLPAPFVMKVLDFEHNHEGQIVLNEVLKSELLEQYPDDGYVGKYFEVVKNTRAEGKRYNTFGITELEPENAPATEPEQEKQAETTSAASAHQGNKKR